jgi:hypothetical protein
MNNQIIKSKPINKIIVVGHPLSGYQEVETLLNISGMTPAKLSRRDEFSPIEIGAMLCKSHQAPTFTTLGANAAIEQTDVSPVWNGMALDLLLGNIDQPLWGWADAQSVYLLDYWKGMDPRIAFILVYDTPQQLVAQAFNEQTPLSPEALQQVSDNWSTYNAALLHFYHRNPERCLLVHAQEVRASAGAYLQQVRTRIGAPVLTVGTDTDETDTDADTNTVTATDEIIAAAPHNAAAPEQAVLKAYLAHALVQSDTMQLYEELQSVANLPLSNIAAAPCTPLDAWISMAAQQAQQTKKAAKTQAHAHTQKVQISALSQSLSDANALAGESQQQIASLEQTRTTAQQHAQEQQQENELVLLQLHQVQEELERHYLEGQQQKEKIKNLLASEKLASESAKTAEKLRQDEAKRATELTAERAKQLELIQKAKAETDKALASAQAELNKTQVNAKAQIDVLSQSLSDANALTGESQQQVAGLEQTRTTAQQHAQEQQQENELVLLQMHQVQEELERHYLEGQQQKEKIKNLLASEKLASESAKTAEKLSQDEAKRASERAKQLELIQKAKAETDKALAGAQAELNKTQVNAKAQDVRLTQANALLQRERDTQVQLVKTQAAQIKETATKPLLVPSEELQQENDLLLLQLHQVQEELERYYLENQELKKNPAIPAKPPKPVLYGAAERVKHQLPYRLGAIMIAQSRSFAGCLTMPSALLKQVREFKNEQKMQDDAQLPLIVHYADAYDADRVKQHLSYRLGDVMVTHAKSPLGWLKMPWALRCAALDFKRSRGVA